MEKNILVRERSLKARLLSALTSAMMLVTTVVPIMDVSAVDTGSEGETSTYFLPVKSVDEDSNGLAGATFEVVHKDTANNTESVVQTFKSTGNVDYLEIPINVDMSGKTKYTETSSSLNEYAVREKSVPKGYEKSNSELNVTVEERIYHIYENGLPESVVVYFQSSDSNLQQELLIENVYDSTTSNLVERLIYTYSSVSGNTLFTISFDDDGAVDKITYSYNSSIDLGITNYANSCTFKYDGKEYFYDAENYLIMVNTAANIVTQKEKGASVKLQSVDQGGNALNGVKVDIYRKSTAEGEEDTKVASDVSLDMVDSEYADMAEAMGRTLVPEGIYYLVETNAPDYAISVDENQYFEVVKNSTDDTYTVQEYTPSDTAQSSISIDNNVIKLANTIEGGTFKLENVDQDGDTIKGAVVDIYRKSDVEGEEDTKLASNVSLDMVNGERVNMAKAINLAVVPKGVYYLVETKAPTGATLSDEKCYFEVVEVQGLCKEYLLRNYLELKDIVTIDSTNTTWSWTDFGNIDVEDVKSIEMYANGSGTTHITVENSDGICYDDDIELGETVTIDVNGKLTSISGNVESLSKITDVDINYNSNSNFYRNLYPSNRIKTWNTTVKLKDEISGADIKIEAVDQYGKALKGAVVDIFRESSIQGLGNTSVVWDGSLDMVNGEPVSLLDISFKSHIPEGIYWISEETAPAGATSIPRQYFKVSIDSNGEYVVEEYSDGTNSEYLTVEDNLIKLTYEISGTDVKLQTVDQEGNALTGAVVDIYRESTSEYEDDTKVASDVSLDMVDGEPVDMATIIDTSTVPEGIYYLVEKTAPTGSSIPADRQYFEVVKGEDGVCTVVKYDKVKKLKDLKDIVSVNSSQWLLRYLDEYGETEDIEGVDSIDITTIGSGEAWFEITINAHATREMVNLGETYHKEANGGSLSSIVGNLGSLDKVTKIVVNYTDTTKEPQVLFTSETISYINVDDNVVKLTNEISGTDVKLQTVDQDGNVLTGSVVDIYRVNTVEGEEDTLIKSNVSLDMVDDNPVDMATIMGISVVPEGTYYLIEKDVPTNTSITTEKHYFTVAKDETGEYTVKEYDESSCISVDGNTVKLNKKVVTTSDVVISSIGNSNGDKFEGATLTITSKDGIDLSDVTSKNTTIETTKNSITFVSQATDTVISLPAGNYTLTETVVPEGYTKANSIDFTVTEDGTITIDGVKVDKITMKSEKQPEETTTTTTTTTTEPTTTEPTTTTTETTTTTIIVEPSVILGDVNGDGKVKSNDLLLLKKYLLGLCDDTEIVRASADINGDGSVKSNDLLLLKKYLLGLVEL